MTRSPRMRWVALMTALLLVLTACGSDDETTETTEGQTATTAAADDATTTTQGETTTTEGEPTSEGPSGTLRFGINFSVDDWNNLTKVNETYLAIVYEKLVELAPDGVTLIPGLASEWTETTEEITLTLREGVTFHDGTPFDADAVVANIERISNEPSQWIGMFEPVEEVVVEDDYNITLRLSRPAPELLQQLARRGAFMISPAAIEAGTVAESPVGTSPWVYSEDESIADTRYVFNYYDEYYAPEAVGPENIEVLVIPDSEARFNALQTGEVDVTRVSATDQQRAEDAGLGFLSYPSLRYHFMFLDRVDTFADPLVRQAVCYALDLDEIIEGQYNGLTTAATQRFNEGAMGYNPAVTGFPHDVDRARELMEEAGNPEISFTMPSFPEQEILTQLVAAQLAEIGIDVTLESLTVPQYFSTLYSGTYEAGYNTSSSEDSGPYDYYRYRWVEGATGNPFDVTHPELDAIVEQALAAEDLETQAEIWRDFTATVEELALDCGFHDFAIQLGWNPERVSNVTPTVWFPSTIRYKEVVVNE